MWFELTPTDLSFFDNAPFHFENEAIINASPERVFEIWATGEGQAEWFKDYKSARWYHEPPYGVGSTREVVLKALSVKERFLAWEPGKRMAFTMYGITIPLVKQMAEDLHFSPVEGGRTRFRWKACYRPSATMRVVHPIGRRVFGGLFSASISGLTAYLAKHPHAP